jgi:probable F420-dependent oxidoreductase
MRVSIPLDRDVPDHGLSYATAAIAGAVETAGLHAVSASDHPFPYVSGSRPGHQAHDPFTLLTHASASTRTIALHFSLLVVPYRNPFITARMLATLDVLSGGRVIAGLGAGYLREEFDALGSDYDRRNRTVDESITAMTAAWTGQPVHRSGVDWHARGNTMTPRPVRGRPTLWGGGNSALARRRAIALLDGWAPFESQSDRSAQTATRPVNFDRFPLEAKKFRQSWESAGRTGEPQICLVRTTRDWLTSDMRIVDEIGSLQDAGVGWIEIRPPAGYLTARVEWIHGFANVLSSNGLLDGHLDAQVT